LKLAEQGAHVAFTYVSDSSADKAAALEAEIQALGVKAKAYKSNAAVFAECESLVADVLKEFGAIDICVNNAGISKDNLLLRMTEEQWDDVMDINLKSVYNVIMDTTQILLTVVLTVTTILLIIIGFQFVLVLKELRTTLKKVNGIIEAFEKVGGSVEHGFSELTGFFAGAKGLFSIIDILHKKKNAKSK
jgi:hypothetical protein